MNDCHNQDVNNKEAKIVKRIRAMMVIVLLGGCLMIANTMTAARLFVVGHKSKYRFLWSLLDRNKSSVHCRKNC